MVIIPSRIRVLLASGIVCVSMASPALAQTPSAKEAAYHDVLQRIADQKITIAQREVFVAGQKAKMVDLRAQIKNVPATTKSINPMIEKMVAGIEREINADFPFKRDERLARLNRLKEFVEKDGVSVGEKYRRALNVYKIEVNYGQGLETYPGNHPVTPTIRQGDDRYKMENGTLVVNETTGLPIEMFDGDYLRYGRTALVYLDGSGAMRYDLSFGRVGGP